MASMSRIRTGDRTRQQRLEQLLSRQGIVLRNGRQILRDAQPAGVMDVEEISLDAEEQRIGLSLLELTSQTVRGIETALQRLEAGEFGLCSDCRERIASARLRALPFADFCLACQERRDLAARTAAGQATAGWKSASR
jgi:RNA polymerase-binding transcription factor